MRFKTWEKTSGRVLSYIDAGKLKIDSDSLENLSFAALNDLNHIFDLLGSGPVELKYGMTAPGFLYRRYQNNVSPAGSYADRKNLSGVIKRNDFLRAEKWRREIDEDYRPIDWHIDFKSGFRFDAHRYDTREKCRDVIGTKPCVEIKAPWELGRMYHLPRLSLFALFCPEQRERVLKEFRNQLLDFMVMNPPGRTVQWSAVMDVSIRAVNLLVAFDILRQIDEHHIFTGEFENMFWEILFLHGKEIMEHLEYGNVTSNHYLADLAGVVFIGAYLGGSPLADAWLSFGAQELIRQVTKQFHDEGSQYEGSTSYHRLSTECVLYPTALIYGALKGEKRAAFENYRADLVDRLEHRQKYSMDNPEFFPGKYLDRIYRAGLFAESILKPNGEIVQIGDNDSGRLLKLSLPGRILSKEEASRKYANLRDIAGDAYMDENMLDHRTLVWAVRGLFEGDAPKDAYLPEYTLIKALSGGTSLRLRESDPAKPFCEAPPERMENLAYRHVKRFAVEDKDQKLTDNLRLFVYRKFGICIFRSDRLFLSVVVDTARNTKLLGHTHNDRLSMELMIDEELLTGDPGSFIYTSAPNVRNRFRSTSAHNTIRVADVEQSKMGDTFQMLRGARGAVASCTDHSICLWEKYGDVLHMRKIEINEREVAVTDACNHPFRVSFHNRIYSNGYGRLMRK